ncbi:hypothetical protein AB0F81_06055 [Actinoplanes sp. NPDC024001]|uniref:hypothetical protein n=1 Tax=Actinoplanes sp. NPDC024001 TaxID=3154598 RepID=UPI0033D4A109
MVTQAPPHRPVLPGIPPVDDSRGNGDSAIAVTMKYAPLAFLLGLFTPVLEVDGQDVPAMWGRVVTSVAFGPHLVHVHVPYLLPARIGTAETTVVATPGGTVELEYRAPLLSFMGGALGTPPQRYPGLAAAVILLITAVALALCGCFGIILSAVSNP